MGLAQVRKGAAQQGPLALAALHGEDDRHVDEHGAKLDRQLQVADGQHHLVGVFGNHKLLDNEAHLLLDAGHLPG